MQWLCVHTPYIECIRNDNGSQIKKAEVAIITTQKTIRHTKTHLFLPTIQYTANILLTSKVPCDRYIAHYLLVN